MNVRSLFWCTLIVTVVAQGLTIRTLFAGATERSADPDKVYYGNAKSFQKPGVLRSIEVYKQIPEYQRIVDLNLDKDDPEYWVLATRASQKFHAAVARTAKALGLDLVGEVGAVRDVSPAPPDVTGTALRMVKEHPEG